MERIDRLVSQLRRTYLDIDPTTIQIVRAPLRICPLGAHIDHQLGLVTGMTIDQSILMAFAPAGNGRVRVSSLNFEPPVSFDLNDVPPYRPKDWGNYIRGAVLALQQDHPLKTGLAGVIEGDMPIGGLSSSAAATIAYLLALESVNGLAISPEQNVNLVRFTENQYIGLNNGVLDQSVILFSAPNALTRIDCRTMQIERVAAALPEKTFEVLVVYSGVTQVLVGTSYNNRVAECQAAAKMLLDFGGHKIEAQPRLGLVELQLFEAEGHRLPDPLKKRASHYFGEMRRVRAGLDAWQTGDLSRFGELMNQSGESSINNYECGSPQLITLYETLRETPGVYGARFSGAGFRGNCIAFIDPAYREPVAEAVQRRYPAAHPEEAARYSIHFCQTDDAAGLVAWSS
jgi:galactokinase